MYRNVLTRVAALGLMAICLACADANDERVAPQPSAPYDDLHKIADAVKVKGLPAVARERHLSPYDESLLSLMGASPSMLAPKHRHLSQKVDGPSADHRARFSIVTAEKRRDALDAIGHKRQLVDGGPPYGVFLTNHSSEVLDQVIVFFQRHNEPFRGMFDTRINVKPGETAPLTLGKCAEMQAYQLGVYIGREMVARIPLVGSLTPAGVSQIHPKDQDPCNDFWDFVEKPGN